MADNSTSQNTSTAVGGGTGADFGSLLGYFLTQGDRDKALAGLQNSVAGYQGLDPRIAAQTVGPSAANSMDPATRAAQLQALGQLQQIYKSGGMDAQAKADQAAATQQADQNAQALQSSIQNQMAQRGLASSGANFAAQRAAAQNAANLAAMQGLQAQAAGENRALQALQGAGALAGQTRQGDFDRAQMNDAIARFNAGMTQNAQQQTFNNALSKQQGIQSANQGVAGYYQNDANKTQQVTQGAGQGLGALLGYLGKGNGSTPTTATTTTPTADTTVTPPTDYSGEYSL